MDEARGLLSGLFEQLPVATQIYRADGSCLLVNRAFQQLFGSAPAPGYNVLEDDLLERQGFLELVRRAFAGETVRAPQHWYALPQLQAHERRRIGIEVTLFPLPAADGQISHIALSFRDVTAELELRIASEALQQSEQRFRATFEQAAVGVAHVAPNGQWLNVNQRLCEIVGYTRLELLEQSFQDITYAADLQADLEFVRRMLVGELATYALEKRYIRRDGALVWVELTVSLVRNETGAPEYFIAVVQDISERNNVERALRDSEARKGAILEAALDSIVTMDHAGLITEFNPAAERTFGYSRASALGKPLVDLLVPARLRAQHLAGIERYRATGVGPILGKRLELPALRADGSEFPVELAVVPTLSNGVPMFTAYVRDITERKQAAEALLASEARFGHLADSGLIGIIIADTLGNIQEANDAFLDIVGFSRAELTSGRIRWSDMTPPEQRHLDDLAITQLERTGVATPWEKEYIRKDGSRAPVLVGVALLDASRGIAFVLDLTERNRAQAAGAHALRVAERESAHRERAEEALRQTEAQLRQSQKMEAVGTLAGSIAHDFNNILSVILSYADLLLGGLQAADPMRADLEQVARAGQRAADLTHQLLAFSRQQVLKPKIISLNDAISTMTQMLQRLIGEDIELAVHLTPDLGAVFVDPSQIEQVLLNLVVNARDAMPRGGKLTIETAELILDETRAAEHIDLGPGRYVTLSVSDTGRGMDSATQLRMFDPFFTTKEKGRGTGLGLSTVFGIVKQSGGSISVSSEVGCGSTLKIYLPRLNAGANTHQPERASPAAVNLRGVETVLLVEDNAQVRALVTAILRRNGYQVLEAATGGDALLICEQHKEVIHLLLTDVVMPRMSGRELWERLAPLRPSMKVLFMSGYTDDAVLHHGVLSSDVSFIQKPLMPGPLIAKLREVLDCAKKAGAGVST
ncbi:MAG TPA: PAS domain S-box protein [Polyangiaceae bacterium]|nr:PAS domain S-box protein [Polyangiaceae bacterium]